MRRHGDEGNSIWGFHIRYLPRRFVAFDGVRILISLPSIHYCSVHDIIDAAELLLIRHLQVESSSWWLWLRLMLMLSLPLTAFPITETLKGCSHRPSGNELSRLAYFKSGYGRVIDERCNP